MVSGPLSQRLGELMVLFRVALFGLLVCICARARVCVSVCAFRLNLFCLC